jgi:hypothetical protein
LTGLDREIASLLVGYERSGRLRFAALSPELLAAGPRLSLLVGEEMRAFHSGAGDLPALAGALAGVSHQSAGPAADSWLTSVQNAVRMLPGPLAALTFAFGRVARGSCYRFLNLSSAAASTSTSKIPGAAPVLKTEGVWQNSCGPCSHRA